MEDKKNIMEYDFLQLDVDNDPIDQETEAELTEIEESDKTYSEYVFTRLKMAKPKVKKLYSDFRNEMAYYSKLVYKSNKYGDYYLNKDKVAIKVIVYANLLKVYFNLNLKDIKDKFPVIDVSKTIKYEKLPVLLKVSSSKDYKNLLSLLELYVKRNRISREEEIEKFDYETDCLSNSQEILSYLGYEDLVKESCDIEDAESFPTNIAKNCLIYQENPNKIKGKKIVGEVTIGELSAAFKDKYDIDLSLLIAVGIIDKEVNYLKIKAMGQCRYKLSVMANEYELDALKMIICTGGNAIKYF